MYHFDGVDWIKSQTKTGNNQAPLFDMFDASAVSFGDADSYPVSSFAGSPIISYKQGIGGVDKELGFAISYLNIDNVGDIQFAWNLDSDVFNYTIDKTLYYTNLATGFYKFNTDEQYDNGWLKLNPDVVQPIIDTITVNSITNEIVTAVVDWTTLADDKIAKILFYLNGVQLRDTYTRNINTFSFTNNFAVGDVITIKIFADTVPDLGYYEIPMGLEKNPLNESKHLIIFLAD
jgi:hypothetical protein